MKNILTIFFIIVGSQCFSQKNIKLSNELKNQFVENVVDSIQILHIVQKADKFADELNDSSFIYYNEALQLAKIKKNDFFRAKIYHNVGYNYFNNYKYGKAIKYYEKALELYVNSDNLEKIAELYSEIGYCYTYLLSQDKAIQYYFKSLSVYKNSLNDQEGVAMNLVDIGELYYEQENFEFATKYFNEALEIYIKLEDKIGISRCYINLGNAFSVKENYKEGFSYYFKSIEIEKEIGDLVGLATNYNNIGDSYLCLQKYDIALAYFKKALKLCENKSDLELIALVKMNLAEVYFKRGNFDKSIDEANESFYISTKINNLEYKADNLLFLSQGYEKLGDVDLSLCYLKEYQVLTDSIFVTDKIKKVALFKALNDLERNRLTINELSAKSELTEIKLAAEKKVTYFLIILASLFCLFLIFYISLYSSRKRAYIMLSNKNHLIERMNDEIRAQSVRLKQLNNTKDSFFSIIAHDLKNPFNSILGFSDLLVENFDSYSDEKKIKFLKMIKTSSLNASNLLSNLLLWANNQSGNLKFEPSKVNLSDLVNEALLVVEIQALNKAIVINNKMSSGLMCEVDENMIGTVVRNLISNAIKFTFEKGIIEITSTINEHFVEICIKDNGVGISEANQLKLFSIEEKDSTLGTANENGSGLGLILCKDFVEKHGGKIWVKSAPNLGSEFWFSLPILN